MRRLLSLLCLLPLAAFAQEDVLLRALLEPLSPGQLAALQQKGLSLFDLQQLAQKRGHKAQGFRIHERQLASLSYPAGLRLSSSAPQIAPSTPRHKVRSVSPGSRP